MKDNKISQKVENYLLEQLNKSEKAEFEKEIRNNKDIREEVNIQKLLLHQIDGIGKVHMKQKLEGFKKDFQSKNTKPTRRINWFKSISAVGAVAAAIAFLLIGYNTYNNATITAEEIYVESYTPYTLPFGDRSTTNVETLSEAGFFYQNAEFEKAIPMFEDLIKKGTDDSRIQLALGISYMETEQFNLAIERFTYMIADKNAFYFEQAQWYAALCYLKINKPSLAKSKLEELVKNSKSSYQVKAKNMLEKIN